MAKVIYYVAATIDGFIAAPNDNLDWLFEFSFDAFQEHYVAFMADVGALVMGSSTYEFILGQGVDQWTYGSLPTWVLSQRQFPSVPGGDIHFVAGDVSDVHSRALEAAAGKNVWVIGGGDVAAQFADRGLLDELHLTVMPVVLGAGKPLLPLRDATKPLELLRTTHFERGAVELVYRLT